MHYAIIAAGEGSRLQREGVKEPKPLVQIEGQPMIDRLIGIMERCHAESISVICNQAMSDVSEHLRQLAAQLAAQGHGLRLQVVQDCTPSSMHSLARLSGVIPAGKVVVTTVDTICREPEFRSYVSAFERASEGEAVFAVTPYVDDEKPLWVSVEHDGGPEARVSAFADSRPQGAAYVSGGIYGLDTRWAWPLLQQCLGQGVSRMRNYQRALLTAGITVRPYSIGQIMDIDHATDIVSARQWLARPHLLAVRRAPEHSPHNVQRDAAILEAVVAQLREQGVAVAVCDEDALPRLAEGYERTWATGYEAVLHMARRLASLARLAALGIPTVNRARSVMNVSHSREFVLTMLQRAGVEVGAWWAYDPEEDESFSCDEHLQTLLPAWVKATRSDGAQPDDVRWVETPLEADTAVLELAMQQVPDIVVMHHEEGDLMKVYCVMPSDEDEGVQPWLSRFYPQESGYSKFGQAEQRNTALAYTPCSQDTLLQLARQVSLALGLQVFGMDVIVRPEGTPVVIDVNDWPSFGSCRQEAASAIARMIISTLNHRSA